MRTRRVRRKRTDGTRRARRLVLPSAALVVGLAILLLSCSPNQRPQGGDGAKQKAQASAKGQGAADPPGATDGQTVYPVSVVHATKGDMSDYVSVSGGISAARQVDVYADMAGKLIKLNVRLGQFVAQDDVVAEVDPSRPGQNYVPSPVRAPIAGTITSLPVDVGSRIAQGVPVVQIATTGELEIRTQIAERYIGVVHPGEKALIDLEPYPGVSFAAHVAELSPVVDPSTRTMEVSLRFDAPDERVKAGMFAEIKIVTVHKTNIVKVPIETVVLRGERTFLFVMNGNGTVSRRDVKVGINVDGKAEIASGLEGDETVVARGQTLLEDGSRVKVIEELPALPAADSL